MMSYFYNRFIREQNTPKRGQASNHKRYCAGIFALGLSFYSSVTLCDMDLTEKAKKDKAFLLRHGCTPEFFSLRDHIEMGAYNRALADIERIERLGIFDRYVYEEKACAYYNFRKYDDAITALNCALQFGYVCELTSPRLRFVDPQAVAFGVIHFNISEIYSIKGETENRNKYFETAFETIKNVLNEKDNIPQGEIRNITQRLLSTKSLHRRCAN